MPAAPVKTPTPKKTAPRRLSPEAMREAAEVAAQTGVCIVIEAGGKVYRFDPNAQSAAIGATERERARCDAAFGLSE